MKLIERADHLRRLAGTAVGFGLLFGGGAVLALTVFPLLAMRGTPAVAQVARNQRIIHTIFKTYVGLLKRLGVLSIDVDDPARLVAGSGRIIVSNHPTLLDVVLLMAVIPRAQCIVKGELWTSPYLRGVVRYAGYIRNDLPFTEMQAACRASLAAGSDLIIFPEGTRSRPGHPIRFKRGTARIALSLRAQIQVVRIDCFPLTLTKGEAWWRIPPQRPRFQIFVGPLVEAGDYMGYNYQSIATRRLTRTLEDHFVVGRSHG